MLELRNRATWGPRGSLKCTVWVFSGATVRLSRGLTASTRALPRCAPSTSWPQTKKRVDPRGFALIGGNLGDAGPLGLAFVREFQEVAELGAALRGPAAQVNGPADDGKEFVPHHYKGQRYAPQ